MKPKMKFGKKPGGVLNKASPTILTCVGAVGVIATAVLAVRATPKALECIDRKEHENRMYVKLTPIEKVKISWPYYVPAVLTGTATLICIFGANTLNRRQQASLASAYALVSRSYSDYKRKLKEIYGKEAHEKIMDSLAAEKAENQHIFSSGFLAASSLEFEDANEEFRLFYDSYSQRYFQATISQVLQAEYHLNRNFALMGGFVPLNMFYEFLGIETSPVFAGEGWWVTDEMYWIDFDHSKTMIDDGLNGEVECYIIDMVYTPMDHEPD